MVGTRFKDNGKNTYLDLFFIFLCYSIEKTSVITSCSVFQQLGMNFKSFYGKGAEYWCGNQEVHRSLFVDMLDEILKGTSAWNKSSLPPSGLFICSVDWVWTDRKFIDIKI